jgi:hypothetical protein
VNNIAALVLASSALFCLAANAQYVKGNEAVRATAAGMAVETPPMPTTGPMRNTKPCMAAAACFAGAWLMVETSDGLVECTEAYARPGTCRASTYGSKKLARLWVVKRGTEWLQCQYPDVGSKCVNMFARPPANMPYDAVQ